MKEVKTKLYFNEKGGVFIYLPQKLTLDSAFPFSSGQTVVVRIEGKKLVMEGVK